MTVVTTIAQRILDENNYTVDTISLVNLEYVIDNAIDYVNLVAERSIADLSGVAEAKSLTGTDGEIYAVKAATVLMLRAYCDRGPNTSVHGLSITSLTGDPQYTFYRDTLQLALARLTGRSFEAV